MGESRDVWDLETGLTRDFKETRKVCHLFQTQSRSQSRTLKKKYVPVRIPEIWKLFFILKEGKRLDELESQGPPSFIYTTSKFHTPLNYLRPAPPSERGTSVEIDGVIRRLCHGRLCHGTLCHGCSWVDVFLCHCLVVVDAGMCVYSTRSETSSVNWSLPN